MRIFEHRSEGYTRRLTLLLLPYKLVGGEGGDSFPPFG
jgi:hypothetical protein